MKIPNMNNSSNVISHQIRIELVLAVNTVVAIAFELNIIYKIISISGTANTLRASQCRGLVNLTLFSGTVAGLTLESS